MNETDSKAPEQLRLPAHWRYRKLGQYFQWLPNWVRPYESSACLLAKYAWLNTFTRTRNLNVSVRPIQGEIDFLYQHLDTGHRLADSKLWRLCHPGIAICPDCLEHGYHSELPQVLGLSRCPVHDRPLRRTCKSCGCSLNFGWSPFRAGTPFICEQCRQPILEAQKISLKHWLALDEHLLVSRFSHYLPKYRGLIALSDGDLGMPFSQSGTCAREVFEFLAKRRYRTEWAESIDGWCVDRQHTFQIGDRPVDALLKAVGIFLEDINGLAAIASIVPPVGQALRTSLISSSSEQLGLFVSEPAIPLAVKMTFQFAVANMRIGFGELLAQCANEPTGDWQSRELLMILIVRLLSLWQVLRILLNARKAALVASEEGQGRMPDWTSPSAMLARGLFPEMPLLYLREDEGYYVFHVSNLEWRTPFIVQRGAEGVKLTVFQARPCAGISFV